LPPLGEQKANGGGGQKGESSAAGLTQGDWRGQFAAVFEELRRLEEDGPEAERLLERLMARMASMLVRPEGAAPASDASCTGKKP
jgi:hypothetical protein